MKRWFSRKTRWVKMPFMLILSSALSLTACSLGPVKTPVITTYTLAPQPIKSNYPKLSQKATVLLVARPMASSGYTSERMVYSDKPYQLSYYQLNRWVDAPANLLLPLMVKTLSDSGQFLAVVSPPYTGQIHLRLETELLMLQHDLIPDPSVVRLALRTRLIAESSHRVIATRDFTLTVPTNNPTPYASVAAANAAVAQWLQQLAEFCVTALAHEKSPVLPE